MGTVYLYDALNNSSNVSKTIKTGGDAPIEYTDVAWEDLNFDPTKSGGPAAQRPDDVTINNCFLKEFDSGNNQSCGDSEEIPHKAKLFCNHHNQSIVLHLLL